ncbi:MAG: hypothetical protein A3A10_02210 [Candidatus Tagabacteria bacterium RIFCSPLOWO2_01_FULL_42_9]|uniref:DUF4878 domain-containing protein n=1 Tax=Candidatus Tagabacteria bacterium RIFCSPLOWO2_01_FULL_42_9 TaxID=1802296 RepID=A0A1G2LVQ5_9BACT|nr:MAG: hypothetical protein A3A10_02210 [Candidatus Tagabacteria bacterium RIFCSPLOWO2_01_FULL_42_9]
MDLFKNIKSNKIFWGVGLLAVGLFLFAIGYDYYDQRRGERRVEKLAEALRQMEQEIYNKKAADKIGGKTPQETLDMFIKAVEAGDYELASKYLIIENQEEGKKELLALQQKNSLNLLLNLLKNTKPDGDIINGNFRMKSQTDLGPYYFVRFVLYPSGNWKIEEI